jgi:protein-tyrosine phosphatase
VATTGIHNFRDYGGYSVAGGGRLVRGVLYRSGEHSRATDSDLELVSALRISGIFDLRGSSERQRAMCRRALGFSTPVFVPDGQTHSNEPRHRPAAATYDAVSARRDMCERYSGQPFRPELVKIYARYFAELSRLTGPTLVYCAAGKDRTGLLVALLHHALGVHPDDIFEDYLLTNTTGDSEARISALRHDLQLRFGATMSEDAVRIVLSVEPIFLQSAFDSIIARHRSVDGYLADVMHVTPALRDALVTRLVV